MHPLRWFFTNQFMHLRAFLMPPARHDSVPPQLRERLERRLETAIRLAKWRIGLYVLIYSTVLSAALTVVAEALDAYVGAPWMTSLANAVVLILQIVSPLGVLALIALVPVNRTLTLLNADIHVLGMEVVSRNVQAGGVVPSNLKVTKDLGSDDGHPRSSA